MKIDKYAFNSYLKRLKELNIVDGKEEFVIKTKRNHYLQSHSKSNFKNVFLIL